MFTKAIDIGIELNKADFYHNRGFAYWKLKQYDLAIDDYTTSISLNPNFFKAYYNWAFCYDKQG